MKLLITGGAGFIGSHLCLRMLKDGHDVVAFDDLSLGKEKFLAPCFEFKTFKFIKDDLLNLEKVVEACAGVDRIWHLAANSDIAAGGARTDIDLKIGTIATYNVLESARRAGVKEFVFASTSAIYGEAAQKPTREDYGPLLPISFYGASKLACEALVTAFAHNFDMKVWIYRFANIVGSHTTHGAIHDFIKKLKKNPDELEILGDGNQRKSYLHVQDCIEGMLLGIEKSKSDVNLFNLASEGTCSVSQIGDAVIDAMGLKAEKRFTGGSRGWKGDVAFTHLDGTKLEKQGFKAKLDSVGAIGFAVREILADGEIGIS